MSPLLDTKVSYTEDHPDGKVDQGTQKPVQVAIDHPEGVVHRVSGVLEGHGPTEIAYGPVFEEKTGIKLFEAQRFRATNVVLTRTASGGVGFEFDLVVYPAKPVPRPTEESAS